MVFPVILDGKCNVLQDLRCEKLDYIKINKYSSVPLYEQIRQCIIEAIQKGILKPGQKLPTEEGICKACGVYRPVVRQAYNELVNSGRIERKRGCGSFVKGPDNRGIFMNQLMSFDEEMKLIGKVPSTRLLSMEKIQFDEDLYQKLELAPSDVCLRLERLRYSNGIPFVYTVNYLSLNRFPKLDRFDFSNASLYQTLKTQYDVLPVHSRRSIAARSASPRLADSLEVPEGTALLVIENIVYDQYDCPIELSIESISGETHQFSFDVFRNS